MEEKNPLCLVILDGFGVAKPSENNAITMAETPTFSFLKNKYFYTTLKASGPAVGLPEGFVGGSEVGHMTIGAGRIIVQPLTLINNAINSGDFFKHPLFSKIERYVKQKNHVKVHIIGLLSDAGVHAYINHFEAILKALILHNIHDIFFHPILDGRDVPVGSAFHYVTLLEEYIKKYNYGHIATLQGRFYGMDRDNNLDRTEKSFNVLTKKSADAEALADKQCKIISIKEIIKKLKKENKSEEFLEPVRLDPAGIINKNDVIIFMNYREERMIQLAKKLAAISHYLFTMIPYEGITADSFYQYPMIKNSLKEVLSDHKKTMFSIAETEKFAHITYFLGCEHQKPFPGEIQKLIPSLKMKTYAETPKMQAPEITKEVLEQLKENKFDVYFINYANADMVGHSGNFESTVQAIECLDEQISQLYEHIVKKNNGILIITGDHGKAESMFTEKQGVIITGHSKNPVPLFVISSEDKDKILEKHTLKGLKDIAPLILDFLNIPIPKEME